MNPESEFILDYVDELDQFYQVAIGDPDYVDYDDEEEEEE